ncbi:MAG TPA: hypothetical protein VM370_05735 [Candidatus Thermoplasmatota archaeon]|nr:hypothetical protein [Candidatus Thermoplasmatota archaeon]
MSSHAGHRARRRHAAPSHRADEHRIGEEALHFTRWFARSKYHLMGEFLGDLVRAPEERNAERLKARYCRALEHAQRVLTARGVVTFLLALGAIATAGTAIANALHLGDIVARAAAISASATVALVALRLLFDRYLQRVDVTVTFLAIELATAPPQPSPVVSTP